MKIDPILLKWEKSGDIKKSFPNKSQAESLIAAALDRSSFAKMYPIEEKTATGIFESIYESFHMLGQAAWQIAGYKAEKHEPCMEILISASIDGRINLQNLDRFRKIRNDANYRGYKIKPEQAKEIMDIWDSFSDNLIKWIRS